MPTTDRIKYLLQAWTSRKASPAEEAELFDWVSQTTDERDVEAHILQLVSDYSNREPVPAVDWEALYAQVLSKRDHSQSAQNHETETLPIIPKWKRIIRTASVAAILILVAAGSWLYFREEPDTVTPVTVQQSGPYKNDIAAPQSNKATLAVEGGNTIILSDVANGSLDNAGIAGAAKTGDNQLVYNGNTSTVVYQTLSNPKFSKPVQLTLADGSQVWLNASSSIRFPSAFTGNERQVTMTGEAYFQVVHDEKRPFKVNAGNHVIEDLGTAFNVQAYDEAVTKTTLVEGSVQIGKTLLNKPGQQLNGNKVMQTSIAVETAWKDGQFYFSNNSVESILAEAARWYDIEVEYKGKVNESFTLKTNRELPISKLLQYMEKSGGVHFEIEGKKVIVKP